MLPLAFRPLISSLQSTFQTAKPWGPWTEISRSLASCRKEQKNHGNFAHEIFSDPMRSMNENILLANDDLILLIPYFLPF